MKKRLCLLCRKYMTEKEFKKHLATCEKNFRKEKGLSVEKQKFKPAASLATTCIAGYENKELFEFLDLV